MINNKINIIHIVEAFTGGICTYMRHVLPSLSNQGFHITLICSLERQAQDAYHVAALLQQQGIAVIVIPMKRNIKIIDDLRAFFHLKQVLSTQDIDIIHTHCSKAGALGRLAAFFTGKKAVFHTPHCFAFLRCRNRFKKDFYLFLERVFGKITTQLIAVSKSEAQLAIQNRIILSERCVTVYNGLSRGWFNGSLSPNEKEQKKRKYGISENARVVISLCRLSEYKGIQRFLELSNISRIDNTVFVLAGEGELRGSVERFIKENRLSHKLIFLGYHAHPEELYEIADIVALCSDAEGQPYTILEAMLARRPVVATTVPGNEELIIPQETGLLAPPTPAGLCKAVDTLLENKALREKLANNAYEYCCKYHLLENQVGQLADIYRDHVAITHRLEIEDMLV